MAKNVHTTYTTIVATKQPTKKQGMQGVSYTTGVPAMIGALMFFKGEWKRPGVNNVEEFNPDPFMEQLNKQGLPWHEEIDKGPRIINKNRRFMMNVGDKAPELLGIDEKGEEIRLSSYKGKKIVLYFYPKDSTSGCTAQSL